MASASVLQRLQQRANQADQILEHLRTQVAALKQSAVANACASEEAKLRAENDQLKKDVADLKKRLSEAEIRNGVKQVPLPNGGRTVASAPVPVAAPVVKLEKTEQPAKPQEKKKEKKEKKPKQPPQPAVPEGPIDVSRLNMKVGQIVNVKKHPDADSLYVEEVNVGEEKNRTIISGLVKHVPLEQMQGRLAIFLCNLKPAKMRGILSEGMIMCGSTPEKVEIIELPDGCAPGDPVTFDAYPGTPDALLNPKKKIWEQIQPDLGINSEGIATYKGEPFRIAGKGICRVPTMKNTPIK